MGAPMVMLHFIKWIKLRTNTTISILFKDGGPLQTEFEQLTDVYYWRPEQRSAKIGRRITTIIKKAGNRPPSYIPYPAKLKAQKFDLVYLNTADTMELAFMLKLLYKCPVVAHIHELSYSINAYFPQAFNNANTAAVTHYIAASNSVARSLEDNQQIQPDKISVFNEFISLDRIAKTTVKPEVITNQLDITGKFIIGAAGQTSWRKGTDLFIQIASVINKKIPDNNIAFVWVGGQSTESEAQNAYEVEKLSLTDKVIFAGAKTDIQNYLQVFDVFTLTSREDPFPLVSLEAAALKKPIFCFDNSGGIPEIIDDSTGRVFEYGNVEAMANGLIDIYQQQSNAETMGVNAAEMVQKYDVNVIAPLLFDFIQSI